MDNKGEDKHPIPKLRKKMPVDMLNMQVGESHAFPKDDRARMQTKASRLKRTGMEFTIRRVDMESCRVWRIK